MPVLRIPTDTGLGDTLGNLGRSLSENFNPLNTIRAYDMQQQMFLRQQQLLQMQRENQARQAAIEQWGHIVPADKLPQIQLMIYQGAPYDQIASAAARLSGNLVDDPNAMQQNIRYIEQITGKPYDYAANGPPVAGPLTAKQSNDWKVSQAGSTAASTALGTKTGEQAATANAAAGLTDDTSAAATANNIKIMETITGKPWDQPYAPVVGPNTQQARNTSDAARASQQATATEQGTQTGKKAANAPYFGGLVDDPSPTGTQQNIHMVEQITGQPYDQTKGPPIAGPATLKANQDWQIAQAQAVEAAKKKGERQQTPIDLTKPQIQPPDQGFSFSPTSPVVNVANPAAPFAPSTPVVRQTPAGTLTGVTAPEATAATTTSDANLKELTQALTEAQSAKQLLPKLNQLHDLVHLYNAAGPGDQVDAATVKAFADKWGVSLGDKGAAFQAIQQLLNSEIPDIRQKAGIQRLAGPAIKEEQLIIGSPNMPPKVMDNIIANEKAAADIQVERGNIAFKARYGQGPDTLAMPDYAQQSVDLDNTIQQRTDDYRKQYGAVGTESQQPMAIEQPAAALGANTVMDAIHSALGWLTGQQPAPTQPPAPPSQTPPAPDTGPQQFQFDPKTNSIVPVQ